jgi:hypothetical protein
MSTDREMLQSLYNACSQRDAVSIHGIEEQTAGAVHEYLTAMRQTMLQLQKSAERAVPQPPVAPTRPTLIETQQQRIDFLIAFINHTAHPEGSPADRAFGAMLGAERFILERLQLTGSG